MVKSCSGSANANQKQENPIAALQGVENEIIVFIINEGGTENVGMATKYFIF